MGGRGERGREEGDKWGREIKEEGGKEEIEVRGLVHMESQQDI